MYMKGWIFSFIMTIIIIFVMVNYTSNEIKKNGQDEKKIICLKNDTIMQVNEQYLNNCVSSEHNRTGFQNEIKNPTQNGYRIFANFCKLSSIHITQCFTNALLSLNNCIEGVNETNHIKMAKLNLKMNLVTCSLICQDMRMKQFYAEGGRNCLSKVTEQCTNHKNNYIEIKNICDYGIRVHECGINLIKNECSLSAETITWLESYMYIFYKTAECPQNKFTKN